MKKILIPAAMLMLIAAGCNKTATTTNSSSNTDQNSNSASAAQQSTSDNNSGTSADANAQANTQSSAQTPAADAGLHYSGEADAESMNQPEVIGVDITAQGFNPVDITINKGDFVQFTNRDAASGHQPVSDTGLFGASASLANGKNYRFQFMTTGTFTYHDQANSALKGTINVK